MYKTSIQSIQEALDFVGREEQKTVLNALSCMFHNEGYFLQGNTAKNDIAWLAASMWNHAQPYHCNLFDRQPEEVKATYLQFAKVALDALPGLCERIADRYIAASKAIQSMENELKNLHEDETYNGREDDSEIEEEADAIIHDCRDTF